MENAVAEGYPKTPTNHVQSFVASVADSVRRRVENIPPPKKEGYVHGNNRVVRSDY
jgi:hypothetical protein